MVNFSQWFAGTNGVPTRTLDELKASVAISRSFDYFESFYSIYKSGKRVFVLEERPKGLKAGLVPTQKDLQKHRTFQKRLANNPIKKAEYFQRLMESTGASSIRQLAEMTGEDWAYIAKVLKTLELPQGIRDFLLKNPFMEIVKYFHLRRLLEILRTGDEEAQFAKFRDMLGQISADSKAPVTRLNSK